MKQSSNDTSASLASLALTKDQQRRLEYERKIKLLDVYADRQRFTRKRLDQREDLEPDWVTK